MPRKSYRLPEAREAAAAAVEVLEGHFPGADWMVQARDGLEVYLQRCIEQFAGTRAPVNAGPIQDGADYTHRARTATEIKETIAAEEAAVSAAPKRIPRYQRAPTEIEIPDSEVADPLDRAAQPPPAKPDGWVL